MRGAQRRELLSIASKRIIPADAGSTTASAMAWGDVEDHPRGCGEHPGQGLARVVVEGSSPRMRGALFILLLPAVLPGTIPADAGSTMAHYPVLSAHRDHPRGCGEH